jgi:hypothetical protein
MLEDISDVDKRKYGVTLFNATWDAMERPARTPAEDDAMLAMAYASAYFWSFVAKPENFARSQWQLSRVYTVLGRAEPALYHAQRSLDLCIEHDLEGWDRPFAYEALARAHALAGDASATAAALERANVLGARIEGQGDRDHFFAELATIEAPAA